MNFEINVLNIRANLPTKWFLFLLMMTIPWWIVLSHFACKASNCSHQVVEKRTLWSWKRLEFWRVGMLMRDSVNDLTTIFLVTSVSHLLPLLCLRRLWRHCVIGLSVYYICLFFHLFVHPDLVATISHERLISLVETYREYSLAPAGDLIRFSRSKVRVTAGCRGCKGIHIGAPTSKSIV